MALRSVPFPDGDHSTASPPDDPTLHPASLIAQALLILLPPTS
jgi:hypothetical protein